MYSFFYGHRKKDILLYVNGIVYNDKLSVRIISDPNNPSFTYSTSGSVQYGCFALEDIPKNQVLGLFCGIYMKDDEINEKIKYKPDLPISLYETCKSNILIDGFTYRNEASYINDCRNGNHRRRKMNVLFFHALIDDILPVVVMISLEDIREGEELLSDYGPEYWNMIEKVISPSCSNLMKACNKLNYLDRISNYMKLRKVNKRMKQIKMEKEYNNNDNQSPKMINHSNVMMNNNMMKEEKEEEEENKKPIHVELYGKMEIILISDSDCDDNSEENTEGIYSTSIKRKKHDIDDDDDEGHKSRIMKLDNNISSPSTPSDIINPLSNSPSSFSPSSSITSTPTTVDNNNNKNSFSTISHLACEKYHKSRMLHKEKTVKSEDLEMSEELPCEEAFLISYQDNRLFDYLNKTTLYQHLQCELSKHVCEKCCKYRHLILFYSLYMDYYLKTDSRIVISSSEYDNLIGERIYEEILDCICCYYRRLYPIIMRGTSDLNMDPRVEFIQLEDDTHGDDILLFFVYKFLHLICDNREYFSKQFRFDTVYYKKVFYVLSFEDILIQKDMRYIPYLSNLFEYLAYLTYATERSYLYLLNI